MKIRNAAVTLLAFIGIAYFGSLNGSFHFDDSHSIEANVAIRSIANIPSFWTDPRTSSFIPENRVYRPLVYTFYSFCWLLGGGSTWPFHVMKILMHWMVALALFLIWRRLFSQPGWFPVKNLKIRFPMVSHVFQITPEMAALFLAILFGIHPATSECVDYIAATTSLQCAMFYVWAFYFYLEFRDSKNKKFLGFSLLFYFLSVASKEEGITLPAMVGLTELFLYEKSFKDRMGHAIRAALPFIGVALGLAFWIYVMHPTEGNESRGWVTPYQYFITQWRAYVWYMRLWFWPWDFNADVAAIEFSKDLSDPLAIQAGIGNALIIAFAWFQRRRFPAFLYGLLWFYVTISPASSVVVLAEAINEHRMYLAYVGFVGGSLVLLLALADYLFSAEKREIRLGWVYAAIVIGLFIGTQERNRVWSNDENLWTDTVAKNPTSGRALNNLALVYMARGQYDKSIELLNQCEKYWTTYMVCPLNKAIAFMNLGGFAKKANQVEEALKNFIQADQSLQRAYAMNPKNVTVNFELGRYNEEVKQDYEKAITYYKIADEVTGNRNPAANVRIAFCYESLKKTNEAKRALASALSVEPNNQDALYEKARLAFEQGNHDEAISSYEHLLSVNSSHLQGWYNYGVVLLSDGKVVQARKAFERTVELDPKSEQGLYNLAFTAEKMGDGDAAIKAARQLVAINSNSQPYKDRMKQLESKFGK